MPSSKPSRPGQVGPGGTLEPAAGRGDHGPPKSASGKGSKARLRRRKKAAERTPGTPLEEASADRPTGVAVALAGVEQAVSLLPPAIVEAMALVTAAAGTGEARLSDGDLLMRCEQVVGAGLKGSMATGIALTVIREKSCTCQGTTNSSHFSMHAGGVSAEPA